MTIKLIKRPPNGAELRPEGRLDATTAPDATAAFLQVAQQYADIELNFAELTFISSAGLRSLLSLQKQVTRSGGSLTLSNVSPAVMEVFELTGLSSVLQLR